MNARTSYRFYGWVVLMGVIAFSPLHAGAADDEIKRLTAENEQLREQIQELTAELETLRQALAALQKDNTELEQETQVLEQQANELQAQATAATTDHALAAQAERIQVAYDKKKERTTVTFGAEVLEAQGIAGDLYFSIVYSYPGAEPTAVESATLFLQNYRSGRLFDETDAVEFFVDDEPMSLPIADYDLTPRKGGLTGRTRTDRSDEIVHLKVDRAILQRLGEARTLTYRKGRAVVMFDQDDLAAMRAMAQRMAGP
ncbi:MAG: hypothetical protein AAF911_06395 [Planctomycetota bacterium]